VSTLQELGSPGFPFVVAVDAQGTAATPDEWTGVVVPFAGRVTKVDWVPKAAVTANGTNFVALNVRNRGNLGTGTTLVATRSYAATNSVAFKPETLTLNATPANLKVAAGDSLTVERIVTASGVATPAGTVIIWIAPN
jgi:hypothetical protein